VELSGAISLRAFPQNPAPRQVEVFDNFPPLGKVEKKGKSTRLGVFGGVKRKKKKTV
jgi:hypothetical protein